MERDLIIANIMALCYSAATKEGKPFDSREVLIGLHAAAKHFTDAHQQKRGVAMSSEEANKIMTDADICAMKYTKNLDDKKKARENLKSEIQEKVETETGIGKDEVKKAAEEILGRHLTKEEIDQIVVVAGFLEEALTHIRDQQGFPLKFTTHFYVFHVLSAMQFDTFNHYLGREHTKEEIDRIDAQSSICVESYYKKIETGKALDEIRAGATIQ